MAHQVIATFFNGGKNLGELVMFESADTSEAWRACNAYADRPETEQIQVIRRMINATNALFHVQKCKPEPLLA
ncbi:hypothetical protein JAO10_31270 [Burkholderia contaminans]|nr:MULTISPECIES: hypothetical protein [Burkholderia cepacia complex]MBH9724815.1 hypothetical protein [Burkholderia contaminans]MBR8094174.1 hypothetical protein [Burkholderia cenocepacia]MBY4710658.1 hypothetical protein [Burkholderia cepacia]MBY4737160.1 hypothetical protein [Burkholderia cepacia]MBY4744498.1 hypothetical protein [Burkholderia cepacia]